MAEPTTIGQARQPTAAHTDDGEGGCLICREWIPGTDDVMVRVPWPCAVVREAEARADELDVPPNDDWCIATCPLDSSPHLHLTAKGSRT